MFQKLLRDITVAGLADGNSVVSLKALSHQVEPVLSQLDHSNSALWSETQRAARVLFDPDAELGAYRPDLHDLNNRGVEWIIGALPESVAELERRFGNSERPAERRAANRARGFLELARSLRNGLLDASRGGGRAYAQSAEYADQAKHFCVVYAAACCIHRSVFPTESQTKQLSDSAWLCCSLDRLWSLLYPLQRSYDQASLDACLALLEQLYEEGRAFSFFDVRLGNANYEGQNS
jgi:hypothetical protein